MPFFINSDITGHSESLHLEHSNGIKDMRNSHIEQEIFMTGVVILSGCRWCINIPLCHCFHALPTWKPHLSHSTLFPFVYCRLGTLYCRKGNNLHQKPTKTIQQQWMIVAVMRRWQKPPLNNPKNQQSDNSYAMQRMIALTHSLIIKCKSKNVLVQHQLFIT